MADQRILPGMDARDEITKARPRRAFTQTSVLGVRRVGGWVTQDPIVQLQAHRGIDTYREMSLNDPTLGGILFAIDQAIRQVEWDSRGVGEADPRDREAKDFLRSNMNDMAHTWDDFVSDATTFLPYGWSLFEEVYKLRLGKTNNKRTDSQFKDGKIGWQKFHHIHQTTFSRWIFDEEGDGSLVAFEQRDPNSYRPLPEIPLSRLIHFRAKHASGNPEGQSIFRTAWRPWVFKKLFEEIEGIGVERDLAGLPKLVPPEGFDWEDPANSAIVTWAREFVTHIRRDEYEGVIMPGPDWTFELMSAAGSRQFDTNAIINRYDKRMAMTALAQFLMLGMERIGSFALVKSLSDLWMTAIDGYVKGMTSTLNKYPRRRLFELNPEFEGIDLPSIEASKVNVPALDDLARMLTALQGKAGQEPVVNLMDPEVQDELLRMIRMPIAARERRVTSAGGGSSVDPEARGAREAEAGGQGRPQRINGEDQDA